jgi:hypothetical protein
MHDASIQWVNDDNPQGVLEHVAFSRPELTERHLVLQRAATATIVMGKQT